MVDISYWDENPTRRARVLAQLAQAGLSHRAAAAPSPGADDGRIWLYGVEDLDAAQPTLTSLSESRPVLVLWEGREATSLLAAMRAGARDVVPSADNVADAAKRLLAKLAAPAARMAPLVAVCSPKGGAGKSFLTANLAVALHRHTQKPTTVLDLSLPAGNQAMYFDLQPQATICDLLALAQIEPEVARQALTRHASGVELLAGPPLGKDGGLAARDIRPLLSALGQSDGVIVADLGSFLGECHAGVLTAAALILVPVSPHIGSLASLPATLAALEALGVPAARLVPVLMEASAPGRSLPNATLAELTGGRASRLVPWGGAAVSRSIDDGMPLTWSQPRHRVARAITALAVDVAAQLALTPAKPGGPGFPWWPVRTKTQGGNARVPA